MAFPAPGTVAAGAFERDGYLVIRSAVGPQAVDAALRMLNLALRRRGVSAEEIDECQESTFFPDLCTEPQVWALLPAGAAPLLGSGEGDEWTEPQLLMRFPDEDEAWPLQPHVDRVPEWAAGRRYKGIVAVALTTARERDGTPYVWPGTHRRGAPRAGKPVAVPLEAGDALVMHPALEHGGSPNLGGTIRTAVYFRLLAA